jgi:hypothetical protein
MQETINFKGLSHEMDWAFVGRYKRIDLRLKNGHLTFQNFSGTPHLGFSVSKQFYRLLADCAKQG